MPCELARDQTLLHSVYMSVSACVYPCVTDGMSTKKKKEKRIEGHYHANPYMVSLPSASSHSVERNKL